MPLHCQSFATSLQMRLLLSTPPSPILILLSSSSSHSQNLTFSRLNKPTPSPFLSPFSTLSYRFFPTLISYPRSPIFGHFSGDELRRKKFPGVKVPAMSTGAGDGDKESNGVVEFELSPSSLLKIQKGDITQWSVDGSSDAIVNAANERMLGGGGVDGAIHRAAGPELREACYKVPEVSPGVRCPVGEARITPGFRLPASHVIHTVGPIYDVDENPVASLANAYRNSLRVAKENSIHYVAFAAISCGIYGYPFDEAASVALSTIREHANDFKEVHFVLFTDDIYCVWIEKAKEIVGK